MTLLVAWQPVAALLQKPQNRIYFIAEQRGRRMLVAAAVLERSPRDDFEASRRIFAFGWHAENPRR